MIIAAYEGFGSIFKNLTNVVCLGLNTWGVWQHYMISVMQLISFITCLNIGTYCAPCTVIAVLNYADRRQVLLSTYINNKVV